MLTSLDRESNDRRSILSLSVENRSYYKPDRISKPSVFDGINPETVNPILSKFERLFSLTDLTLTEVRVIISLFTYDGLTMKEISVVSEMKQPLVSKAVRSLVIKDVVRSKSTKTLNPGRPSETFYLSIDRQRIVRFLQSFSTSVQTDLHSLGF